MRVGFINPFDGEEGIRKYKNTQQEGIYPNVKGCSTHERRSSFPGGYLFI